MDRPRYLRARDVARFAVVRPADFFGDRFDRVAALFARFLVAPPAALRAVLARPVAFLVERVAFLAVVDLVDEALRAVDFFAAPVRALVERLELLAADLPARLALDLVELLLRAVAFLVERLLEAAELPAVLFRAVLLRAVLFRAVVAFAVERFFGERVAVDLPAALRVEGFLATVDFRVVFF